MFTRNRPAGGRTVISHTYALPIQSRALIPDLEARASVLSWAKARGIAVQEDRGWIILESGDGDTDPLLKVLAELLKGSA